MPNPTMLTYINQEQTTMQAILAQYPTNIDTAIEAMPLNQQKVLVLATGSSINAAYSAKHYIEKQTKMRLDIQEPYNYTHYEQIDPELDLVIGISQSGQSTATIEALERVHADHSVFSIGVTSIPGTEITQATNRTLDILTGRERVGYVSLGFTATVLNLMLLGLRVGVKKGLLTAEQEQAELAEFNQLASQIDTIIASTTHFFEQNRDDLRDATQFTSVAYGPSVGTTMEMATKFSEVVRVPSQGFELEAFMHGPYLEVNDQHYQFFIETLAETAIQEKQLALKGYEQRYTDYVYTISFKETAHTVGDKYLQLPKVADEFKVPFVGATVFQVLAWYICKEKGINLSDMIFTDFSEVVHNKTTIQDYV